MSDKFVENKLKLTGKVLPNLVHSIRNPLSVLKLNHYFLRLNVDKIPNDILSSINDCSKAVQKIEETLETFAQLTITSPTTNINSSLNEIIDAVVEIMEVSAKRKSIIIEKQLDNSLPLMHLKRNNLLQVLINFLAFGISLSPTDKRIFIKTSQEENNHIIFEFWFRTDREFNTEIPVSLFNDFELCKDILNEDKIDYKVDMSEKEVFKILFIFNVNNYRENVELQNINHR